jgi:hypothetical protein
MTTIGDSYSMHLLKQVAAGCKKVILKSGKAQRLSK